jgi:hypothetical protein
MLVHILLRLNSLTEVILQQLLPETLMIDVLASSPDGLTTVSNKVKASGPEQRENFARSWWMQKKHENVFSDNFLYVFVDLKPGNEKPDFCVVPSKIAAKYIKQSHASYLRALCLVL